MAKNKIAYSCSECGAVHSKWSGQCVDCGQWNCLVETVPTTVKSSERAIGYAGHKAEITTLSDVNVEEIPRIPSGLHELDRVLGGGLVAGSVILIGGDPGVGKSTILLQSMSAMSHTLKTLYVTGEESLQQVSLRSKRLGLDAGQIRLLTETQVESILNHAQVEKPNVMVVDSIQTIHTQLLQSAPGGVSQVRESAAQLVRFAKQTNTAIFVVGHVTKDGALAGPRVLEHMVDGVLYFEGESDSRFRVIRAVKNRFGAVNELGVFAMSESGLKEVKNPSAIFLSRFDNEAAGSAIIATWEGSRPLLVEVQALVAESHLANPRRVTVGLDQNRLAMLLAVLNRHGGIVTYDQDVFINVVGGVRVTETSADLGILFAILSSLRDQPLPKDLLIFGEVGLAGEIRPVPNGQERLREAAKHGFKQAIVPKANCPQKPLKGMDIQGVQSLQEALEFV